MSTPSGKYDKAGWKKYEFPPDMITAEQNEKKMKLSWPQIKRLMSKQIESRIYSSSQSGDAVTAKEWKAVSVKMQAKDMSQRINEEFIQDFIKWLTGRSVFNSTKYFEVIADERGTAVSKEITGGCPWGNKPLVDLPGVSEFLDQGLDRRSKVIDYIAKLKLRGPRNLDEAFMYYKYILRKVAVDDDACYEVQEMADFDYPTDPDTGNTVGPDSLDSTPPLFNETRYTSNFLTVYSLTMQAPELTAEWILNGAKAMDLEKLGVNINMIPVNDVDSWLNSIDYELIYKDGKYQYVKDWIAEGFDIGGPDTYIEREKIARSEVRERERRRKLRKAGRAPSAKMAAGTTAKKGADLSYMLGPEGRQKSRRLARREARRDDRIDDDREDLATALTEEYFGTQNYVSFWALSPSDQDYIMASLLATNAFALAAQALVSPASTGAAGGPVYFPEARRNEEKYAFPGEETEKLSKGDLTKRLDDMAKKISGLPGAGSDPAVAKYLKSILQTTEDIKNKMDNPPPVYVHNNQTIDLNTGTLTNMIEQNTIMLGSFKKLMGKLNTKLDDLGGKPGPSPPPQMPPGMTNGIQSIDDKLTKVIEVLEGMPKVFSDQVPKVQPGPPRDTGPGTGPGSKPQPPPKDTPPKNQPRPPKTEGVKIGSAEFASVGDVTVKEGTITAENARLKVGRVETINNEYHLSDINIPILMGSEIGKHMAENLKASMPKTVNVNVELDADQILVPDIYPQVKLPEDFAKDVGKGIDFTSLEAKMETFLTERYSQMEVQLALQSEVNYLFEEIRSMKMLETVKLEQMKEMLDAMTPLQKAVAGILAKDKEAAEKIKMEMDIEEETIEKKIPQVIDLSEGTIKKLLDGDYAGVKGLKQEINDLNRVVFNSLTVPTAQDEHGVQGILTTAMMARGLLGFAGQQSNILNKIQNMYAPEGMEDYLPARILTDLHEKLQDPNSVFGGKVSVAKITDKNFLDMQKKLGNLDTHLKDGSANWKLQKENVALLHNELQTKFEKLRADAEKMTTEQKQAAWNEVIALRNQYALKEGELANAAQNFAALAASHTVLEEEIKKFKTLTAPKPPDNTNQFEQALANLFTTKLKPALDEITSAIENSPMGLNQEEEPPETLSLPPSRQPIYLPYSGHGSDIPVPEAGTVPQPVQEPELFVSPSTQRARNALESLIDEVLTEKGTANVMNVLTDPITKTLDSLWAKIPQEKRNTDPSLLTFEERLVRNEIYRVEEFVSLARNTRKELAKEARFGQSLDKLSRDKRYELVNDALHVMVKGQEDWQTPHNVERFTDVITKYRESINEMEDAPTWMSHSVLAEEFIGKLNGPEIRNRTGYELNNEAVKPQSTLELDAYVTLARVAREMVSAYYATGDADVYQKLTQGALNFDAFKHVPFVSNSPLYNAIAAVDPAKVTHALSQEGTEYLNRDYYSQSIKVRTDMLYDQYQYSLFPEEPSTEEGQNDPVYKQEDELADRAYVSINKSGLSESALISHPDYQKDVFGISADETSIYLQAFLKATILSSFTKNGILTRGGQTFEEMMAGGRSVGKDVQGLEKDVKFALQEFTALANNDAKILTQNLDIPVAGPILQTRKDTVDTLAGRMYEAMLTSLVPEFRAISTRGTQAQQKYGIAAADSATEAVDTLVGLGTNPIIQRLQHKRGIYGDSTSLPSGRLLASQLKKSMALIEGPAQPILHDLVEEEKKKEEFMKIKAAAEAQMRNMVPTLIKN